jgi:hypothetical protein
VNNDHAANFQRWAKGEKPPFPEERVPMLAQQIYAGTSDPVLLAEGEALLVAHDLHGVHRFLDRLPAISDEEFMRRAGETLVPGFTFGGWTNPGGL